MRLWLPWLTQTSLSVPYREHCERGLGKGTFGHGAASGAILRIDPTDDLVIVMTRNAAGANFGNYHPQFIQAIADGILRR